MDYIKLIAIGSFALINGITAFYLGKTLHGNGLLFIKNALPNKLEWAEAINNVLLVGFYLVNLAFILLYSTLGNKSIIDVATALAFFTQKTAIVYLVLGIWHHVNIVILLSIKFIHKKFLSWKSQ
ncbi:MAG: hypothetical protein KDC92_10550 [Bacteroidetes bacterium]|nr:hypothetical protein [Bacteroidota bacterium]